MKIPASKLAVLGLLLSTAIWGSTFFIIKDSLNTIHPVALVAYRFGLAAVIFATIVLLRKEKLWAHAKHGFILGLFVWIIYLSQTLGLQFTTASNSGFITGLFILFVPLFSFIFFRKKPKIMQLVALGIALMGLWLLTGGLQSMNTGDIITFVTAISIGLNILVIDKYAKEKKSISVLNFQQFFTTSVLSFITAFVLQIPLTVAGDQTFFSIVYLAIFGSAIAQGLQLLCQRHLKALTSSLLLSTEPVFAAIFAWTLGGEVFLPSHAIGGLFIIVAIVLTELRFSKKQLVALETSVKNT